MKNIHRIKTGFEDSNQQFILFGIVVFRFWKRNSVFIMISQTHTKAIGLHFLITGIFFTGMVRINSGKNTAFRVTRFYIRINFFRTKVMLMMKNSSLNTIPFLPINIFPFPANMVAHSGSCHKIAFVSAVNKNCCFESFPTECSD